MLDNKNLILATIVGLGVFVLAWGLAGVVNVLYQNEAPSSSMAAQFGAGDLLVYVGSVLSCIGTIFLGLITFLQTREIQKKNDEMLELQASLKASSTKRPFFLLKNVETLSRYYGPAVYNKQFDYYSFECSGSVKQLDLRIETTNIGDGPALNARGFAECINGEYCPKQLPVCMPNEQLAAFFRPSCDHLAEAGDYCEIGKLRYENILGNEYAQSVWAYIRKIYKYEAVKGGTALADDPYWVDHDYFYEVRVKSLGFQESN